MKQNQDQNSSDEELRFENEFRKLKIAMETGAQFYSGKHGDGNELPLQIEKQFLDNIEAFDEALQTAEEVNVFEFLGRPEFKNESELQQNELEDELNNLQEMMFDKGIVCDVIYELDDRVLYKFITEELFLKTTTNIKVPGFICHFIYEEFHPNHREDIKALCMDLLNRFFNNELHDDYRKVEVMHEEIYNELPAFRNSLSQIRNVVCDEVSLEISGHLATVNYHLEFDGIVSEGLAPIHFDGTGLFKLECDIEGEFWHFTHMMIPGMRRKEE